MSDVNPENPDNNQDAEVAAPSRFSLAKDWVKNWVISKWAIVSHYARPYVMPVVAFLEKHIKALAVSFWQGPVGRFIEKNWQKFLATAAGKWLAAIVKAKWDELVVQFEKVREIYRKLTSPPPDPLMAAMMMQNEPIDLPDDDITMTGNKVFLYITTFFTVLVLWAAFTELDEVVRAEGTVVPPGDVQVVQNRLPGSVVDIQVKLGDYVEKGQVLFRLEDEDVKATFDDNEIQLVSSLVAIARLKAEADGAEEITFPPGLENSALEVVTSERSLFQKRTGALNASLTVIDQNIRENVMLAENLKERMEIIKPLVEKGYEPRLTLLELESNYDQTILAAQKARDEYKATIDNFRADAASQLAEHEVAARQAGAREDAYLAKVRHADVRAPSSGIVTTVKVKTVGAVLQAGTVLAEIVPDEQSLLIRARLPADDVANVYPGQIAQVSLSTYDVSRYGSLEGMVQRIAQNTTQEEGIPPYYVIMIEVPNPQFSKSETPVEITTGTPTVIDIIGKKRTVLSYILTPLERAAGVAFREQ